MSEREQLASQRARFDEIVTGLRVRLAAAEELAETFEATDPGENWRNSAQETMFAALARFRERKEQDG